MLATCASESLASASLGVLGHPDDEGDDPGRPPYGTTRVGRTAPCSHSPSRSRSRSPESHVHFAPRGDKYDNNDADAESLVEDDVGFDVMSAFSGGARSSSSAFGASGGNILLELKRGLAAEQIPRWYTAEPQFGVLRQPFFRSAREVLGDVVIFEKGPESSEPRFNQMHFKTILTKKEFPFQRNALLEQLLYNYYWWRLHALSIAAANRRVLEELLSAVATVDALSPRSKEIRGVKHTADVVGGFVDLLGLLEQELMPTDSGSINSKFYQLRWRVGSFYDFYMSLVNADADKTAREICEWYCSLLQDVRAEARRTSENGDVHPSLIQLCNNYINTNRESTETSEMIALLKKDEHAKQPLSVLLPHGERGRDRGWDHGYVDRDGWDSDDSVPQQSALEHASPGGASGTGTKRKSYPKRPYQAEKIIESGLIPGLDKSLLASCKKRRGISCVLCLRSPRRASAPLTREYKSQADYRQQHDGASPYDADSRRKIKDHPGEVIIHSLHRCEELGLIIADHVEDHPQHKWMLDPLTDEEMAAIFPPRW